mmetsp:Transcript_10036/g.18086  ORF Transcript_10036/g.18086 Transcript_10036/m.18086 type:complete len:444 (-) Transcript_10036:505-1836(-)
MGEFGIVEVLDPLLRWYSRVDVLDYVVNSNSNRCIYYVKYLEDERTEWIPASCLYQRVLVETNHSETSFQNELLTKNDFLIGDVIEVSDPQYPCVSCEAYINAEIGSLYHIIYPDGSDQICGKECISKSIRRSALSYSIARIPISEKSEADLEYVQEDLELLKAQFGLCRVSVVEKYLEIVGKSDQIMYAEAAVGILVKRTSTLSVLRRQQYELEKRMEEIESSQELSRRNSYEASEITQALESVEVMEKQQICVNFEIDHDLFGFCVGKGNTNLLTARKMKGIVSLDVEDLYDNPNEGEISENPETLPRSHQFWISATDQNAADRARELVEFVRVRVCLQRKEIRNVLGRKGAHLKQIQKASNTTRIVLVDKEHNSNYSSEPYLEVIGRRKNALYAAQLLEEHIKLIKQRQFSQEVTTTQQTANDSVDSDVLSDLSSETESQ